MRKMIAKNSPAELPELSRQPERQRSAAISHLLSQLSKTSPHPPDPSDGAGYVPELVLVGYTGGGQNPRRLQPSEPVEGRLIRSWMSI